MLSRTLVAITLALTLFSSASVSAQAPVTQADINRAKAEIELLKQDIEIRQAELRVMELQLARQSASPAPKPAARPATAMAPAPQVSPSPASTASPGPSPTLPLNRADVDPTPYEKSSLGRVPQFRTTQSSKWLVLDEKRVVFWVLNEEAYMLNLMQTCPGLLNAEKIKLESFSTKVRAGHDGIVFGGQRCLIESITKLGGKNLPKPPKK